VTIVIVITKIAIAVPRRSCEGTRGYLRGFDLWFAKLGTSGGRRAKATTRGSCRYFSRVVVCAMSEKVEQPLPVTIVALRAESYSASDESIVISLRAKYSTTERTYSVPIECLRDLIIDLQRLSVSASVASSENASSEAKPPLPLEAPQAAE
jgi:hypothetical protein